MSEGSNSPEESPTPSADAVENWLKEQRPEAIRERAEAYLEQFGPIYKRAVEERRSDMQSFQVPVHLEESGIEFELLYSMISRLREDGNPEYAESARKIQAEVYKEKNGGITRVAIERVLTKLAGGAMPDNIKNVPTFDKSSGRQPHVRLPLSGLQIACQSQDQAKYYQEKLGGQITGIAQTSGVAPALSKR